MTRRGEVHVPWTGEEIKRVKSMFDCGMSNENIAEAMHRTKSAIRGMRQRLGLSAIRQHHLVPPARAAKPVRIDTQPQPGDGDDYRTLMRAEARRASVWHLIDLKRAGHSPTRTEQRISPDSISPMRMIRPAQIYSTTGSSAAMCADNAGRGY